MNKKVNLHVLFIIALFFGILSCSSNDDEKQNNGSDNTTDVAVTSNVSKLGITYAQIDGYVNLNMITSSYTNQKIGVELSMGEKFDYPKRAITREMEGNKITIVIDTLSAKTKYYYRTFVEINDLNYYGEKRSFTTNDFSNITSTGEASDITFNSAKIKCLGDASSIDKDEKIYIGVAYSTTKAKLHPDSAIIFYRGIIMSSFSSVESSLDSLRKNNSFEITISRLQKNTTYYYCSYTRAGLNYKLGEIRSFTTDDNEIDNINIPIPSYADKAVQYSLDMPKSPENAEEDAPQLKTIDFTESGDLLVEFFKPISKSTIYLKEKATINGSSYTVNGMKMRGTIKVVEQAARVTRSGSTNIIVDVAATFSAELTYTYTTKEGESITVKKDVPPTGDQALDILARTWNVLGLILDLKGDDVKAFETWTATNGLLDLRTTLLKGALDRGVSLTSEEQDELRKTLKSVTITKTKLFDINYTDAPDDVASWDWTDSNKTGIRITLKDGKMGNKFIKDASMISFTFNGDRCNMKIATTFTDNANKKWDAIVTLQLQLPS